ncbi:MAG TPA: winged helix-turn-helix domain-containing protein [Candidatus Nitrosopolaris sp.]|nr:winged helix-turn-helix domain-containing protein [Candidatus Nitrosopolaris sp.]
MTGETQLRARRTRIKILRAIADKNGSACFSEIRNATGLSTGSIYYHLERMGNYVNKNSKHYIITEEGIQMLRELDSKFPTPPTNDNNELPSDPSEAGIGRNFKHIGHVRAVIAEYSSVFVLGLATILVAVGLFENFHIIFPNISTAANMIANATMISSLSIAALLSVSFVVMLKRQILPTGYKGIMISALTVLAVLVVNILIFSGLGTQIGMSSFTF